MYLKLLLKNQLVFLRKKPFGLNRGLNHANPDMKCVSVGSCELHIINNAFRKGVQITEWNLSSLLNSLYWIFKDSPARREDFLSISAKKKFPVKFCPFRWLENCQAAERAIEIWQDVVLYVKKIEAGNFSKVTCKSYSIVAEATKDSTVPIKLNVFLSVAKVLKPFLALYQSEKPLLPFFAEDILKLVKQCLHLFHVLNDEDVKSITTPEKLCKFDFTEKSCYAPKHTVSLGFIGDKILKEMLFKKQLSDRNSLILKYECQKFVLKMIQWLMVKCPANYLLVRNAACLDPRFMISNRNDSKIKMKRVLSHLSLSKQISDEDGDEILIQYEDFLLEVAKKSEVEFKNFDPRIQSLDVFFSPYFKDEKYFKLWNVFKIVLILSHGQASVERGFSVNKAVEVENLKEDSYISQRLVYDNIKLYDEIYELEITKELRLSASSARAKYMQYLENQRAVKCAQNNTNKRKLIENEIDYLQKKKQCLQNDIVECEKEADGYSEKGEANKDISFFLKSNVLRKTIKEKSLTVAEIDAQILTKKNDIKKL